MSNEYHVGFWAHGEPHEIMLDLECLNKALQSAPEKCSASALNPMYCITHKSQCFAHQQPVPKKCSCIEPHFIHACICSCHTPKPDAVEKKIIEITMAQWSGKHPSDVVQWVRSVLDAHCRELVRLAKEETNGSL